VLAWLSVWSEVQIVCILVQLIPPHPKTPSFLASMNSRLVLPLWYRLTRLSWKRGHNTGVVVVPCLLMLSISRHVEGDKFLRIVDAACLAGSMKRSSVRLSVCLSHRSTAAVACAGLAAERLAARRNRSLAGASIQRQRGQRHVDSRRRRLNTDLL